MKDYLRHLTRDEEDLMFLRLRGRVSWRGEYALASELGVDVRVLRRVMRRRSVSPRALARIRLNLAAHGIDDAVPLVRVAEGVH